MHTKRNVTLLFFGVLLPLFGLGLLGSEVLEKEMFAFDGPLLWFLHSQANAMLDAVMVWASRAGSALVLLPFDILVAIYLYRQRVRSRFWFWVLAVGGAALLNWLAKYSFARARPALWVSLAPETTFSFPSGHAMQTMAVVAAITCLLWHRGASRWLAIALGGSFVVLVGISRIYLGVHYPSDVLAGWLASFAWVVGLALVTKVP